MESVAVRPNVSVGIPEHTHTLGYSQVARAPQSTSKFKAAASRGKVGESLLDQAAAAAGVGAVSSMDALLRKGNATAVPPKTGAPAGVPPLPARWLRRRASAPMLSACVTPQRPRQHVRALTNPDLAADCELAEIADMADRSPQPSYFHDLRAARANLRLRGAEMIAKELHRKLSSPPADEQQPSDSRQTTRQRSHGAPGSWSREISLNMPGHSREPSWATHAEPAAVRQHSRSIKSLLLRQVTGGRQDSEDSLPLRRINSLDLAFATDTRVVPTGGPALKGGWESGQEPWWPTVGVTEAALLLRQPPGKASEVPTAAAAVATANANATATANIFLPGGRHQLLSDQRPALLRQHSYCLDKAARERINSLDLALAVESRAIPGAHKQKRDAAAPAAASASSNGSEGVDDLPRPFPACSVVSERSVELLGSRNESYMTVTRGNSDRSIMGSTDGGVRASVSRGNSDRSIDTGPAPATAAASEFAPLLGLALPLHLTRRRASQLSVNSDLDTQFQVEVETESEAVLASRSPSDSSELAPAPQAWPSLALRRTSFVVSDSELPMGSPEECEMEEDGRVLLSGGLVRYSSSIRPYQPAPSS